MVVTSLTVEGGIRCVNVTMGRISRESFPLKRLNDGIFTCSGVCDWDYSAGLFICSFQPLVELFRHSGLCIIFSSVENMDIVYRR